MTIITWPSHDHKCSSCQVLTIAVLAIVLTAPAGAVAISLLGPFLLSKDGDVFDDNEDDDEDEEREGGEGRSVSVEDQREMNGEDKIALTYCLCTEQYIYIYIYLFIYYTYTPVYLQFTTIVITFCIYEKFMILQFWGFLKFFVILILWSR